MAITVTYNNDGVVYTGARTASVLTFSLLGGRYMFSSVAPSTSTTLEMLLPDASTYVICIPVVGVNPLLNATTQLCSVFDLPPGSFQIIWTATGDTAGSLIRIPYRAA